MSTWKKLYLLFQMAKETIPKTSLWICRRWRRRRFRTWSRHGQFVTKNVMTKTFHILHEAERGVSGRRKRRSEAASASRYTGNIWATTTHRQEPQRTREQFVAAAAALLSSAVSVYYYSDGRLSGSTAHVSALGRFYIVLTCWRTRRAYFHVFSKPLTHLRSMKLIRQWILRFKH